MKRRRSRLGGRGGRTVCARPLVAPSSSPSRSRSSSSPSPPHPKPPRPCRLRSRRRWTRRRREHGRRVWWGDGGGPGVRWSAAALVVRSEALFRVSPPAHVPRNDRTRGPAPRDRRVINICARPLHRAPISHPPLKKAMCTRERALDSLGRRRCDDRPTVVVVVAVTATATPPRSDRRWRGARGAPDGARRVAGSRNDYQLYDDRRRPCPQDVPSTAPVAEHVPPPPPLLSVRSLLLTHTRATRRLFVQRFFFYFYFVLQYIIYKWNYNILVFLCLYSIILYI